MKGHRNYFQRHYFLGHYDAFVRIAPFMDILTLPIHKFSYQSEQRTSHNRLQYKSSLALSFQPPSSFARLHPQGYSEVKAGFLSLLTLTSSANVTSPLITLGQGLPQRTCLCSRGSPGCILCNTLLTKNFHFHYCQ